MDKEENKRFIIALIVAIIFITLWLLSEWSTQTITLPVTMTPNNDTTNAKSLEEEVICSEK